MPKIKQLYAWVFADKDEDDEGVPALDGADAGTPGMALPLMGADGERAKSLRIAAQYVANETGKPLRLRVSAGELKEIDVVYPTKRTGRG